MTFKFLNYLFRRRTEKYNVSPSLTAQSQQPVKLHLLLSCSESKNQKGKMKRSWQTERQNNTARYTASSTST